MQTAYRKKSIRKRRRDIEEKIASISRRFDYPDGIGDEEADRAMWNAIQREEDRATAGYRRQLVQLSEEKIRNKARHSGVVVDNNWERLIEYEDAGTQRELTQDGLASLNGAIWDKKQVRILFWLSVILPFLTAITGIIGAIIGIIAITKK